MSRELAPRNLELKLEQMAESIFQDRNMEEKVAALTQTISLTENVMCKSAYNSWAQATRLLIDLGTSIVGESGKNPVSADFGGACFGNRCRTSIYVKPSGKIKINGYHADRFSQFGLEHEYECPHSRRSYNVLINPANQSMKITYCGARRSPWKVAGHVMGCLLSVPLTIGFGVPVMHGILTEHMPPYATYNPDKLFKKLQKQLVRTGNCKAVKAEQFLEEYLALPIKLYGAFQAWKQQGKREMDSRLETLETDRLQLEAKSRYFEDINNKICSIEEKLR